MMSGRPEAYRAGKMNDRIVEITLGVEGMNSVRERTILGFSPLFPQVFRIGPLSVNYD